MNIFKKKEKKMIKGTMCGFCPNVIHLHQESGGILHQKSGVPICARCRILTRSKFADKIKGDINKFDKSVVENRSVSQKQADDNVESIALASQKVSGADSIKKKILLMKMRKQHLK